MHTGTRLFDTISVWGPDVTAGMDKLYSPPIYMTGELSREYNTSNKIAMEAATVSRDAVARHSGASS